MTLAPGSTIGIVGGGQLGRMLAIAAARLGYRCHIYAPDEAPPAAEVAAAFTRGAWEDEAALAAFGRQVDVATYEFENIAAAPLAALAAEAPLHPPAAALAVAQDRLSEKSFIARLGGAPAILEAFIDFEAEFSILLCRGRDGGIVTWQAPRNAHEGGVLRRSQAPAEGLDAQVAEADALAREAAQALDYVGVLALEFFATPEGPLFNEMAPRVHNSGHWTIEGAVTSQFENHIRAICGLPLGSTALTGARVEMDNLIGDEAEGWAAILADPAAHLHLYGKGDARPGRKMGHVTRVFR